MTSAEVRQRILENDDYIYLKRFDFSLAKALERYPDGLPDKVCAQALLLPEEEFEEVWANLVARLRELMGVTL